ncbi:NRPS-like protein [Apiospora arundinis]
MTTQDPPVTPNTFHCFPRLPAELQLMVWEWAALSLHTERGAHFFSVQFLSFAERGKAKAPRVDWQIVRRCREKRTWDKWDEYPHDHSKLTPDAAYWRIMAPHWDRTKEPSETSSAFRPPLPPTYRPNKWSIYSGFDIPFRRPEHSALEFDPSWELDIKTVPSYGGGANTWLAEILGYFLRATSGCNAHQRLWFIDYRLRRNEWKPEVEKPWTLAPGCHVFRGHGCKFVDISSSYEYWKTRSQPQDAPTGTYYHVHDFVRDLEDRIEDSSVSIDWRFLNSRYYVGHHRRHERPFVKVGILACVWE